MKPFTLLVLASACALATCFYQTNDSHFGDAEFLQKQKAVFDVLQHIHQNEVFTKQYEAYKDFKFADFRDHFTNTKAFDEFYHYFFEHGFLAKNEIFSVLNKDHLEQAISLFHLFYYAKDWESFQKTFEWARFHVNEGQFIYAFTVAMIHRKDTAGLLLPAPYEIYPYYFFNSETVQKAQLHKMQGFYGLKKVEGTYTFFEHANYSSSFGHFNEEQRLTYFTEDIGLNSYYYYFHADYPFWMGGDEFGLKNDRRGEYYLYQYQQFLSRYYLERLSNGLGEIPEISFYQPIKTGYYPALRYYNGDYFPTRENDYFIYNQHNYYAIEEFTDYERRIRDSIDAGFILLPDGTHFDITKYESIEQLGNLFQSNPDHKFGKFYGHLATFAKMLLGASNTHFEHSHYYPSVLEHYETAMRDPVFYQLYKRLLRFYYKFQDKLGPYKFDEINFKGVKIDGVEFDKLITYFDAFDADITNVIDIEPFDADHKYTDLQTFGRFAHYRGDDVQIRARQYRLNHLPFTFKLHVNSDKAQKAVVKFFIGPKYDEFGHAFPADENRNNFYELDNFFVDLAEGKNEISRNSRDFSWFVNDRTTFYELYKQLMLAVKGDAKFPFDMSEAHCGFPSRLMLPKGKKGGMTFQFYFIVMPYFEPKVKQFTGFDYKLSCGIGSGARYMDTLPFGFPFDRPIDLHTWFTPNMFYYDANIFHKYESEIQSTL